MNRNSKHIRMLRRLTALMLAAAFLWAAALPAFAEGTEAAQSDIIYINSTADLLSFAQRCAVDSWSKGKTVVLQEDLSLEGEAWEPIPSFSGRFQGNSHEIRDLELDGSYSPAGLFAVLEKDAVIESLSVQGWVAPGGEKGTVGGIVGEGTESALSDSSLTVTDCRALVDILEADQFAGAISGGQEGSFSGNLFVSDTLRGIDRLSKAGQAEPTDYASLIALDGAPKRFQKIMITFKDGDHVLGRVQLDYGDSLDESGYPELPAKEGCAARWDVTELNDVHLDTVVEAVYTDYITALSSTNERDDGRAVFFVKGQFGDRDSMTAAMQDTPSDMSRAVECWTVSIPDDGLESHTVRYLPLEADRKYKVYAKQDGRWKVLDTETIGSYLAFTVDGNEAELAVVPAGGMAIWIILGAAAAAAVLAGVIIIRRKKRKNKNKPDADPMETEISTPAGE